MTGDSRRRHGLAEKKAAGHTTFIVLSGFSKVKSPFQRSDQQSLVLGGAWHLCSEFCYGQAQLLLLDFPPNVARMRQCSGQAENTQNIHDIDSKM